MKKNDFLKKVQNIKNNDTTYNFEEIKNIAKSLNRINCIKNNLEEDFNKNIFNFENRNIKTIKSMLPLLNIENKNNINTIIEFMEINHILTEYKNIKNQDNIEKNKLKKETILSIKNKLNERNKDFIDFILKFMELNEIKNKIVLREE